MEFIDLSLEEIEQLLTKKKIPYENPGFYDHPNFLKEEEKNPQFLEIYAAYVYKRLYSDEYLQFVESTILKISEIFSAALQRNHRLGACIDTCQTVSRILDRFGIWNFFITGCATMIFPPESKLEDGHFHQISSGEFNAAHAWLFCPPFNVLDLTIKFQDYKLNEADYLPAYVASKAKTLGDPKLSDIAVPMAYHYWGKAKVNSLFKQYLRFQKVIRTTEFTIGHTKFRYVPIAMSVAMAPLEQIVNLELDGLYSYDFYIKNIKDIVTI